MTRYLTQEVHNFGGFFGGDTVTFSAVRRDAPDEEETITIDERAFSNVRDRHTIAAGMLLDVELAGERVERAELLGAATQAELRAALGPALPAGPLDEPLILSYRCDACGLWVAGTPADGVCRLCGQPL
jgi:rubrerythrin